MGSVLEVRLSLRLRMWCVGFADILADAQQQLLPKTR
jgi:hypothetical protein